MVEITDQESAAAWLEGKPHKVQVAFAARAALRALPGIAIARGDRFDGLALPVMRSMLTSSVGAVCSTDDVKVAASAAVAANSNAASGVPYIAYCTSDSSFNAAAAASSVNFTVSAAANAANYSTYAACEAASDAAWTNTKTAAWKAISLDAAVLYLPENVDRLFVESLWPNGQLPNGLDVELNDLRALWANDPSPWSFWSRWYEAMLAEGAPLDWKVQEAVALIPNEIWEAGPERVAEQIREIEAELANDRAQRDRLRRQAEHLLSQPAINALLARETAKHIQSAVSINSLPSEFDALRATPAILLAMAATLQTQSQKVASAEGQLEASNQRIDELTEQIGALKREVETLTKQLEATKGKSKRDLFGEFALTTSAKILTTAFWAATFAGVGQLTGYVDIRELLERLHNAVIEPPVGPLIEGETWDDPSTDV